MICDVKMQRANFPVEQMAAGEGYMYYANNYYFLTRVAYAKLYFHGTCLCIVTPAGRQNISARGKHLFDIK